MLSNLIKMFVLSNMASAGAKQLGIGSGNIIKFPMGTNRNIQSAMADPRVLRLLENISIDSISNQTISLDDYKSYDVTESRIDIG
jgi:hypothetical protein